MKDVDRIIALRHMDAGEISPDAAHGIEALALEVLEPILLRERPVDHGFSFGEAAMRKINQAERSERQRGTGSRLAG